jgi:hypothetical protein
MLRKAGASQIGQMEEERRFIVMFTMASRQIRFTVPLPTIDDMPLRDGRNSVLPTARRKAMAEQAARQKARSLMLVVKAKLESIDSEVETFEQAFLANVVMSDGATIYERTQSQIALEYDTGRIAPLMLGGPS